MKQDRQIAFKARAGLEALRAGIVSKTVIELISHGREAELEELKNYIQINPTGSTQVLVGGYGVGKSHLCEVLTQKLLDEGYAVARLELGSSSERAEHPDTMVAAIERSFTVRIQGQEFSGTSDLYLLRRALKIRHSEDSYNYPIVEIMREAHRKFNDSQIRERIQLIRDNLIRKFGSLNDIIERGSLWYGVPGEMTAANRAVAKITALAEDLKRTGVMGLVVLFDEAERSEWASTNHRAEQAYSSIMWFATRASNGNVSGLKTYRNEPTASTQGSSFLHTIFAFTHPYFSC